MNKKESNKRLKTWRWLPAGLLLAALIAGLAVFAGAGMPGVVAWLLLQLAAPALGALLLLGTGLVALVRRKAGAGSLASAVIGLLALLPGAWLLGWFQVPFPATLEGTAPSATVRLPSDSPLRVAWGGDALEDNYHAAYPDQRWAYDLLVEPAMIGSERVEDYGCWGTPVLAPARGTVHMAEDGAPDGTPGALSGDPLKPLGNAVVLLLPDTQTYLILAHLQRGSVAVRPGQEVEEGALLGRCGNSGNTSEPHIHLHHQRQDPRTHPVNFAEGLPLYFRDHDGAAMPRGGLSVEGDAVRPRGDIVTHLHPGP